MRTFEFVIAPRIKIALVTLVLAQSACRTARSGQAIQGSDVAAVARQTPELKILSGSKNALTSQQVTRILEAWHDAHNAYYVTGKGYLNLEPGKLPKDYVRDTHGDFINEGDVAACLNVSPVGNMPPDHIGWSDLMAHYYAHLPSYTPKLYPNVRECFTKLVIGPSMEDSEGFPVTPDYFTAFEYCAFVPVDRKDLKSSGELLNHMGHPNGDASKLFPPLQKTGYSAANAAGPLRWIFENQADVFRFIMMAGDRPKVPGLRLGASTLCVIDPRDQQSVINQFYGVKLKNKNDYGPNDTEQVAECRKKRPLWPDADPLDGTHCSFDLRTKHPLGEQCR